MKPRTLALMSAITLFAALATPVWPTAQEPQQAADGVSNAATGTENPVPLINEPLVPDASKPGSAGFTLTVNGTGFVSGSVMHWNGAARTTKFVSGSKLTASILSSDIAKAGTGSVTVVNPSLGGGTSNSVFFPVALPVYPAFRESAFGAGSGANSAVTGDFNGDGKLDLAVTNESSGNISILLANGDGTFEAAVKYTVGSGPFAIAVGDFNDDGKPDLAVANDSSNNVSILLGNGDGTFQAAVNYVTGSGPEGIAVGDFNADGKLDLVVANAFSNDLSVLLGNGDGTFLPAVNYPGSGSPAGEIAVGDFNRDGNLDLAVGNPCCHRG